ncbi:MAG: transcriptional repressor LexA [Propionibacteriaceae bacterium]|jgi:repressor LexA|nr:transcriptional repressor LexA [Propionibacteriaceae bacterium]
MTTSPKRGPGRPTNREVRRAIGRVKPFAEADGLSPRQRRILEVIQQAVAERGYPPTIREICDAVGLASSSSGAHQLKVLESRGFIRRDPKRPRAMEIVWPDPPAGQTPSTALRPGGDPAPDLSGPQVTIPLLGRIAAGRPILATEEVEDRFSLPERLVGHGQLFMLQVQGDSMTGAAICDGDLVVVRSQPEAVNGEIVAALLDDEATVKTYRRTDDQVWLLPENPAYDRIDGNQATILGKVVTVLRRL